MIASNDNRRLDLPTPHIVVYCQTKFGPLAVSQPANARRQALEMNSLLGQFHPARQNRVVRKHFQCQTIGGVDVVRRAGERGPAKRSASLTEQRTNVFWNE